MMVVRGFETNAELGQVCMLESKTISDVVRGWNLSPVARRRITNALAPKEPFWPGIHVDEGAAETVNQAWDD